jgi:hypothetical protein
MIKLNYFIVLITSAKFGNTLTLYNVKWQIMNSHQSHKTRRKYTSWNKHRPLDISEVGAGALEKKASPVDRSHTPRALIPTQVNGTNRSQDQCIKNGLTIGMKHTRQHFA